MQIRAFRDTDAPALSRLIARNLTEVNRADYPKEVIERFTAHFSPAQVAEDAKARRVWVAEADGEVVGTASLIVSSNGSPRFRVSTVFVLPERHGQGIGAALMRCVEAAARAQGAASLLVPASFTAHGFYEKLGYADAPAEASDEAGTYILMGKPL